MSGKCIISFDCESKWGIADKIDVYTNKTFTSKSIIEIYKKIIYILDLYQVKSTFGFVGCMTLSKEEFCEVWYDRLVNSNEHKVWLEKLFNDIGNLKPDGWFIPETLDIVRQSTLNHEICSHGFTHIPIPNTNNISKTIELEGIKYWKDRFDINIKSFIFPRNLVSTDFDLKSIGITAFRGKPSWALTSGIKGSLFRIVREFYPFPKSQNCTPHYIDGYCVIPGDFFLNWRYGFRRFVPIEFTLHRLKYALKHAVSTNGLVHIWLHPHNLLTGKNQIYLFEECVKLVKYYVDNYNLKVLTQDQFTNLNNVKVDL